ncbi:MAG: hypothetical protein DCC88_05850 [Spirobacillus cienkowskii]|jgi:hypothetical protein|uniref:Uncharacterized protein n=1 Tax=Spirobacillus cienkowskii TaxID=495820 RepID=A0A369KSC9_9BACT|nr:MAG: hypothetical protein DCC88_05850 [Spirobacillus cienkowskii]
MDSEQINNNRIFVPGDFLLNDFLGFFGFFCGKFSASNKDELCMILNDIKSKIFNQVSKNKDFFLNFEEIYNLFETFIIKIFPIVSLNIKKIESIELIFVDYSKKIDSDLEKDFRVLLCSSELYLQSIIEGKNKDVKVTSDKENFENHVNVNLFEINNQIKIKHNNKIYIIKMMFSYIISEFIFKNKDLFEVEFRVNNKIRNYSFNFLKEETDKFFKVRLIINSIKLAFEEYKSKRGEVMALQKFSNFIEKYYGGFKFKENRNEKFFYEYHIDYLFYIINTELLKKMSDYRVLSNKSLAEEVLIKRLKLLNYNGANICKLLYFKKSTFSFLSLSIPVVFSSNSNCNELNNYIEFEKNKNKFIDYHTKFLLKNYGNARLMKDFKTTIEKKFYVSLNRESFFSDINKNGQYYFKKLYSILLIFSNDYNKNCIYREDEKSNKILSEQTNSSKNLINHFDRKRNISVFQSLKITQEYKKIDRLFSSFREGAKRGVKVSQPIQVPMQIAKPSGFLSSSVNSIKSLPQNSQKKENISGDFLKQKNLELLNSVVAEIFQGKKLYYPNDPLKKVRNFLNNYKIVICMVCLEKRCSLLEEAKINKLRLLWDNPGEFLKKDRDTLKKFFAFELISAWKDRSLCSLEDFKRKCLIMVIILDKKKLKINLFRIDNKYYNIIEKSCEKIKSVNFEELPSKKDVRLIDIIYYLIAIFFEIKS